MTAVVREHKTNFSDDSCARCEQPRNLWPNPAGHVLLGERYCCKGCAISIGCICPQVMRVPLPSYSGPERRLSLLRRTHRQERRLVFLRSAN